MPKRIIGLLFACLFPTLLTLFYFVILSKNDSSVQQGVYSIGKILQFTFPLWFLAWVMKTKITFSFKWSKDITIGLLFGLGVAALMIGLINSPLFTAETISLLKTSVQEKLSGIGLNSLWSYILLGIFYSFIHSLLEEYYWRWFVYGQMRQVMSTPLSNLLSSLAFMAHHVIVLAVFFGWKNPLTYLLSLGIALGGMFWAWHYERTQSMIGPWLSHLLVDAAIFFIGFQLVQFPISQ